MKSNKFYNKEEKREIIRNYLNKNPNATYEQIIKDTKIKLDRIYPKNCVRSAYIDAKIPFSKHLSKRSRSKRRKLVIDYIRKNPESTVTDIERDLRIYIQKTFGTIKKAYKSAGVIYPRATTGDRKVIKEKRNKIIRYLKENPLNNVNIINKTLRLNVYKYFKDLKEVYKSASIKYIKGYKKRTMNKQNEIITFIKSHQNATQREVNKICKTHVQEIFLDGIKEAYKKADIKYPIFRLKIHGAANKYISVRAKKFESYIINLLSKWGKVEQSIKTRTGRIDALLNINNQRIVVEIKDYQSKEISYSDVKQVNRYLNDINCNIGWIICHHKPKRDKFYIGSNKVFIFNKDDILRKNRQIINLL